MEDGDEEGRKGDGMDGWGWGGGSKGRPALGARGCLHDNPSSEGAAQWHMNAALHNAVSRRSGLSYCSCTCVGKQAQLYYTGLVI